MKSKYSSIDTVALFPSALNKIVKAVTITAFLLSSIVYVKASDDDWFVITDPEKYTAYMFWQNSGLSADDSEQLTDVYNTTGSIVSTGSFTIVGTDGIGGSMTLNNLGIVLNETFDASTNITGIELQQLLNSIDIQIAADPNDRRDAMSFSPGNCTLTGKTFINGTPTVYDMACDAFANSYYYNNATFNVTFEDYDTTKNLIIRPSENTYRDSNNNVYDGYGLYEGNISGTSTITLTETVNESGQLSQTATIQTQTTHINTQNIKMFIPLFKGVYRNDQNTSSLWYRRRFSSYKNDPFILAFIQPSSSYNLDDAMRVYTDRNLSNIASDILINPSYSFTGSGRLVILEFEASENDYNSLFLTIDQTNTSIQNILNSGIYPLVACNKSKISNEMYKFLWGTDPVINELKDVNLELDNMHNTIDNGNYTSQSTVSNNSNSNQQFSTTSNAYIASENSAIESMESGLQDINTSPDLLSSSKFIQSANWVTNQFNRLVNGTPFELVVTFALVLGIALVFIGKVK